MVFGIGVIYLFTKSLHLLNLIFKLCLVKGRALECYPCGAINFVLGATHYRKLGFKLFATINLRNKLPLALFITWVKRVNPVVTQLSEGIEVPQHKSALSSCRFHSLVGFVVCYGK